MGGKHKYNRINSEHMLHHFDTVWMHNSLFESGKDYLYNLEYKNTRMKLSLKLYKVLHFGMELMSMDLRLAYLKSLK